MPFLPAARNPIPTTLATSPITFNYKLNLNPKYSSFQNIHRPNGIHLLHFSHQKVLSILLTSIYFLSIHIGQMTSSIILPPSYQIDTQPSLDQFLIDLHSLI